MKKVRYGIVSILFCLLLAPKISYAASGSTSLEITPLTEMLPRIYYISDLDFGTHETTAFRKKIHPKQDLVIKLLDARKDTQKWRFEVLFQPLANHSNSLNDVRLKISQGELSGENTSGIIKGNLVSSLAEKRYLTMLASENKVSHGWLTYRIKKEDITLQFENKNKAGKYEAVNKWRFVNAV